MKASGRAVYACAAIWLAVCAVQTARSAEVRELLRFTDPWRYEDSGVDLGTAWRTPAFNDSQWATGPGVFGYPSGENLLGLAPMATVFSGDRSIHTYYFRHAFDLTGNIQGITLVATNLIDDGAIFYLNGEEIGRVAMPAGEVNASTFALRAADISSYGVDVIRIELPPLVERTNVVAVEVHQGGASSSDVVFGMNLWAELPSQGPVVILEQPLGQVTLVGDPVRLSVKVSGTPPYLFQWTKDSEPIAGATNQIFTIPLADFADAGNYRVRVCNGVGEALSEAATVSVVRRPVLLLPFAQDWRYEASGADLGTSWSEPDYDDSNWPSGLGPLGRENSPLPEPLRTGLDLSPPNLTYYFRTQFVVTDEPVDLRLLATNLVDDGVVLFLNGIEVERLGMPDGTVTFATRANRTVGQAAFEVATLPSTALKRGVNVLAAEVHQINPTSADIVFGLSLVGEFIPAIPLSITQEPADVTVAELQPATFEVEVAGAGPRFQWFRDGEPIPEATSRTLTIPSAVGSDAGAFQVRASNQINIVYSRMAQLTVIEDTKAPSLETVDGSASLREIRPRFSENVRPSTATNVTHYELRSATGELIEIESAEWVNDREVRLLTAARQAGLNYILTATGVTDLAPRANSQVTAAPVGFTIPLVRWGDPWRFYDPLPGFDPLDPGAGWKGSNFDDSEWRVGPGGFAYGQPGQALPVAILTALRSGPITSFFRSRWETTFSRLGAVLTLRHLVDDGAVFYLNGSEVTRFNLPNGPVESSTPAAQSIGIPSIEVTAVPGEIRLGPDNLLAAELHRIRTTDLDAVFAAELTAKVLSWANGPIVFAQQPRDQTISENQPLQVDFVAVGAETFQWYADGVPIDGAVDPVLRMDRIPLSWDGAGIRVVVRNDANSSTSAVARLTVLADTTPPRLVDALGEGSTILLTFDEPLDPLSVDEAVYWVLNGSADPRQVVSAALLGETQVLLHLEGPAQVGDEVRVSRLHDRAASGNEIPSGSGRTVGFDGLLVPIEAVWWFNQDGLDLGETWRQPGYNDSLWPSGPALLGKEPAMLPELIRTPVRDPESGGPITVYFRTRVFYPSAGAQGQLRLHHIIDDGMVLYLNGEEVYRVGVSGSPTINTVASRAVVDAVYEGPFDLSVINLQLGENVLAAELHQVSETSNDAVFGLSLHTDEVPSLAVAPAPTLHLHQEDNQVVLAWEGAGFRLQEAPTPTGPWMFILDGSNPHVSATVGEARFYRLQAEP